MDSQAVLTLKNEDKSSSTFRVKPTWKESCFELIILTQDAWQTTVSEEHLENLAKDRNQNMEDYYYAVQQCLQSPDDDIAFKFSDDDGEFRITRKSGVRTLLFFVAKLEKVNFQECVFNILDELSNKNKQYANKLSVLQEEKLDIEREKNIYEDKLVEFIERKSKWEQEMYSNFLLLLNEKKKRIKYLTNILKRKNIDPGQATLEEPQNNVKKSKKKSTAPINEVSESESSNYSDTDGYSTDSNASVERHQPTPCTSKGNLLLDDPEENSSTFDLPKRMKETVNEDIVLKTPAKPTAVEVETDEVCQSPLQFSTQDLIDRM